MRHTREEVIERTEREFQELVRLLSGLSPKQWNRPAPRPETKDPWTIKDSVAHLTHWKEDVIRSIQRGRRPAEMIGLTETEENRLIYLHWKDRPAAEVLEFHRRVHQDVMQTLGDAPEAWFSGRERRPEWPYDLIGHIHDHRVNDIETASGPE